jgi:hypothetical protein
MLLQHAPSGGQGGAHALAGTAADYVWLLPLLPLLGFAANGVLSLAAAYRPGPGDPSAAQVGHAHELGHEATHETTDEAAHGGAHGAAHGATPAAGAANGHASGGGAA